MKREPKGPIVEPDSVPLVYEDSVLADCAPIVDALKAGGVDVPGSAFGKLRRELVPVLWRAERFGLSRLRWAADRDRLLMQTSSARAEAEAVAVTSPGRARALRDSADSMEPEIKRLAVLLDALGDKPPNTPEIVRGLESDYSVTMQEVERLRAARMPVPADLQQKLLQLVDGLAKWRPQEERRRAEFDRLSAEASSIEQRARAALRTTLAGFIESRLRALVEPLEADRERLELLPELAPPTLRADYRELERIAALAVTMTEGPNVLDLARHRIGFDATDLLDVCRGFQPAFRAEAVGRTRSGADAFERANRTLDRELGGAVS